MGSVVLDSDIPAIDADDRKREETPVVFVNGKRRVLPKDLAHLTLLEYLRREGLTGTKLGCGEGGCGACTVMVSHFDSVRDCVVHRAVNACLAPLYSVEGTHVVTVEGIGDRRRGLHPVQCLQSLSGQEDRVVLIGAKTNFDQHFQFFKSGFLSSQEIQDALASAHGSQCGFCTPGFVMSMYALLRASSGAPTQEEIEDALAGNLCRCTGYRPILDAFRVFTKTDSTPYTKETLEANGCSGPANNSGKKSNGAVCPSTGKPCDCSKAGADSHENGGPKNESESHRNGTKAPSGEPIFPPELKTRKTLPLSLNGQLGLKWYRPLTLDDLLDLKSRYPDAKLVTGNTEVGIEVRFKRFNYPVLISPVQIPELNMIQVTDEGLVIGSATTLSNLLEVLKKSVEETKPHQSSVCTAFINQLRFFAGAQIRNVSSVGGNVCTASPISDLNPLWMAAGATFTIIGHGGVSRTVVASEFFLGYRMVDLKNGEILASIFLPWTRKYEYVKEFKQSHRRDDDIALVNGAMRVYLQKNDAGVWTVQEASLVYGGVAAVCVIAKKTAAYLRGNPWSKSTMEEALVVLHEDIQMSDTAPGGMVEFRMSLTTSFLFKFFLYVSYKLEQDTKFDHGLPESYRSAAAPYERETPHGLQAFGIQELGTGVGHPLMHMSAELQVTGEAEYTDDIPMPPNGLHAALVMSTKPHARILSIDTKNAEAQLGFEGYFDARDVPGGNDVGAVIPDEELFATEFVTCVGQAIGIVVADTHENAKAAALKVVVQYEELPTLLSIEDAIAAGSYHERFHEGQGGSERVLAQGDVEACFENGECDHVIEGIVQMGGQEQFYLEPHTSLVWTIDGGNEVCMFSSTQAPQKHQKWVSHVLDLPMSKVVCKTKRIGGGFGGKETRSALVAALACVPAYLLRRPVKLTLDRDTDMAITGQRHAFLGKYKVGFSREGKVLALDLSLFNNGGNSLDLSHSILERAMFHSDNVYVIPNVRIEGRVCFTHLPSNTAFRGFGGPQGMLIAENWMERIARVVNRSPEMIRELNFQKEGDTVHYGQKLDNCNIQKVWTQLKSSCEFDKRRAEVDSFNQNHRWKKRGIAMIPTKFGISFTTKFLNQAGALVQVYTDGTVLVTHGGVEMGQGLHIKVAQIAASAFGIPASQVFISETSTDKVPNSSPTAASASSDMYGAAVLDACEQIKARLSHLSKEMPEAPFADVVVAGYLQRIDLSAHGFYITPDIGFEWDIGKGKPFAYYTFGAAYAETEIDTLTGDFYLRRVDIVMDVGHSLNPAIDIGQIEGGFVQGLGWVALEELKWGDKAHPWVRPGHLFTQGPGTYKIPTCNDIPIDFRVMLLEDAPNPKAVHSSKAVGEPPLFLASATLFAIKDAISAARKESGLEGWFVLDTPATPERIRMACADSFTRPHAADDIRPKLSV